MKFEYRYLSKERVAEIDAMGLTNPYGKKIHINYSECVTDEDETIVFQQIYFATYYNVEHDCDQYLLLYKGYHYFLEIEDKWNKVINDGVVSFYFKFIILSTIQEHERCSSKEVLDILKEILYIWGKYGGGDIFPEIKIPMEIIYKGEKIYG